MNEPLNETPCPERLDDFQLAVVRNAIKTIVLATGADAVLIAIGTNGVMQAIPGGPNAVAANDLSRRLHDSFVADGIPTEHRNV